MADTSGVLSEMLTCLAEGAGIIHYHHDARLGSAESIDTMIGLCRDVRSVHPDSILYPGILSGKSPSEHMAHLVPLADAGVLGLAPLDPGAAVPYDLDDNGLPVGHGYVWSPFKTANRCAADMLARSVPITVGVYEPVQLRWALAYESAGKLAPGSMLKLYFGGDRSLFNIGKPAINFGLPPTPQALDMYLSMMEGSKLHWNVGVMGGDLLALPLARYALERGGHLRVGIEDLAEVGGVTNAETVRAAVALAAVVGRSVATGAAAAAVLSGRDGHNS
ncbi:MAG: 3-keto-5-aminohexanoate cleavage protein [Acidimicrobiia bacterium]